MSDSTPITISVTHHYTASPEVVYDAWLDPVKAGKFLFATPTGEMVRAETDPRVGGSFTFTDRRDGQDILHTGEYLELERPNRIVFDFVVPQFSSIATRITIELVPVGTSSMLTLMHEGVLPEYEDATKKGWSMILDALAAAIE